VTRWWHRRARRTPDPLEAWLRKVLLRGVGPGDLERNSETLSSEHGDFTKKK